MICHAEPVTSVLAHARRRRNAGGRNKPMCEDWYKRLFRLQPTNTGTIPLMVSMSNMYRYVGILCCFSSSNGIGAHRVIEILHKYCIFGSSCIFQSSNPCARSVWLLVVSSLIPHALFLFATYTSDSSIRNQRVCPGSILTICTHPVPSLVTLDSSILYGRSKALSVCWRRSSRTQSPS